MGDGYPATPSDSTKEEPAIGDAPATPGDATEEAKHPDEPREETPPDIVWEEVSTMDELANLLWKMEKTGGNILVTDDLVVPSGITYNFFLGVSEDKPIMVDFGAYTLYVDGTLRVNGGTTFIGVGGEQGLIHVNQGGNARFNAAVVFQALTENDCILYQETGAILLYELNESSVGRVHREPLPEAEAATFEELMRLAEVMNGSGGTIRATADLIVPVEEDVKYSLPRNPNDNADTALLVDMGEHTLYVEGKLRLQTGVKLMGKGSESGLVRVKTGGEANILDATLAVDNGYTVWQEEGAVFTHTPTSDNIGEIHYAEKPVAVPDSYISWRTNLPVAVVLNRQEAEDVLPKTDGVCLYQNGESGSDVTIPVTWNLELYREQLATRERVLITGSYPDAVAFAEPTCLVVFQNGNPAVFLDCWGTESYGRPGARVKVELIEPERGCRFEWSQDGETWLPADAKEAAASSDGRLAFNVTFPQEEPPSYPYYLSAVVDYPDGSAGYSDVIVIREASTLVDNGGNRGGGTDLGPPQLPPPGNDTDDGDNNDTDTRPDNPKPPDHDTDSGDGGDADITSDESEPVSHDTDDSDSSDTVNSPDKPALPDGNWVELPEGNSMERPVESAPPAIQEVEESAALSLEQEETEPVVLAAVPPVSQPEENVHPMQAASASPAKALAQMIAGIAATGAVVLLTITWSPKAGWGKRLKKFLHSLWKR